jgi:hypothetical protein
MMRPNRPFIYVQGLDYQNVDMTFKGHATTRTKKMFTKNTYLTISLDTPSQNDYRKKTGLLVVYPLNESIFAKCISCNYRSNGYDFEIKLCNLEEQDKILVESDEFYFKIDSDHVRFLSRRMNIY